MKKICMIVLALCIPLSLLSHPHMSIGSKLQFEYDEKVCKGFWVQWYFDDFFSASVIEDYDMDKNGKFDEKETKDIYENAFINLKNYGFFVLIREGDRRYSPSSVQSFSASYKNAELSYRFYVSIGTAPRDGEISVAIFDTTYFCATGFVDNPVSVTQAKGKAPEYEIVVNKKYPIYYNPYGKADDNTVYAKWEEGLETAYPEEIRVFFPGAAAVPPAGKQATAQPKKVEKSK